MGMKKQRSHLLHQLVASKHKNNTTERGDDTLTEPAAIYMFYVCVRECVRACVYVCVRFADEC